MVLSKRRGPCLVLKNHPVRNAKHTAPVPSASKARSGRGNHSAPRRETALPAVLVPQRSKAALYS